MREATAFANQCPQVASSFCLPSVTEDCLYLNVFRRARCASDAIRSLVSPVPPVETGFAADHQCSLWTPTP
jgi:carboxylesterase type B